ncbi:MAG: type II toxin-antitoxin system VapC family toxin [Bifidobacteriaceae bacterium]|jgi:ribonuclease VapC|nr:type II toxin-antitoxin system VapC family toxin [Bifidobacteriaceae bacterium]
MRLVVDSSALIAVVFGEEDAEHFNMVLGASVAQVHVSAVSLVESTMVAEARGGPEAARLLRDLLDAVSAQIEPVDQEQTRLAIEAWRQFGKGRHPAALNLGDCFSYALAKRLGAPLLYRGRDFAAAGVNAPEFSPSRAQTTTENEPRPAALESTGSE